MPETETQPQKKTKTRVWLLGLLVVVVLLLIVAISVWSNRKSIAWSYLADWCTEQNLTCRGDFAALGFDTVKLEGFSIESQGQRALEAEHVELGLSWPAFLSPQLTRVVIEKPVVRAQIVQGQLELSGLEKLIEAPSEETETEEASTPSTLFEIPELDIRDGQIELETDAGDVSGTFVFQGTPLQTGTARLHIDPNRLQRGDAEIVWSKGDIALQFRQGAVLGDIEFAIETAQLDGLEMSDVVLKGKLGELDALIAFEISARADRILSDLGAGENIEIVAEGALDRLQDVSAQTLAQALAKLSLVAEADRMSVPDGAFEHGEINAEMARSQQGLTGPIGAALRGVKTEQGSVGTITAAGELTLGLDALPEPTLNYEGTLVLREAALAGQERRQILASIDLPEPLEAHGRAFRNGVSKALDGFQLGLDIDAAFEGEAWSLRLNRPTLLEANSGLSISIDPYTAEHWLRANEDGLEIIGDFALGGGAGMPRLGGLLDVLQKGDEDIHVQVNGLDLAPWTAGGRTLAGRLETLELETGKQTRMLADGELSLAGAMPGLDLKPTRLIGHVSAARAVEGWRVQTHNNSCVGFSSEGIAAGTLAFAEMALSLCPVDGRFVRQENGQSVGRINLGDLSLPFVTGDSSGTFGVDGAAVEWSAADGFGMVVKGRKFHLPLQFSEDTLIIDGDRPEVSFDLDGGPVKLAAGLGETHFGGTMIPANVVARDFIFKGVTTDGGIDGVMDAGHVRITDLNEEAVYKPIVAELSATMTDGVVSLNGPIRSEGRDITIANANMSLHLADFTGTAQVSMVPLAFAIGELQPVHLSEILRDILINARGGLTGQADFQINSGALSGTGYVDLEDLNFDTLNVGTVSGVNGQIVFSDILALTSAPSQKLRIDNIDPGVPMNDGEISFQIVEGTTTRLESAKWPFAGGWLEIMPTVFSADQAFETITVSARELELENLIEVLKIPDLFATGTVSGDFPVDVEGANIMLRQAVLTADEEGGWISYYGDGLNAARGQNEYADYAFEALADFDFKVMRLVADGNMIGRILLSADLLGSSEDVLEGTQFDFNLSLDSNLWQLVNTFNDAQAETYIDEYIELKRRSDEVSGNE